MNESNITLLKGHVSPETAYLVDDYPYGFRLRCQIRYWLEHDPKKGTRLCSQTSNPKVAGLKWNKPKKSTYSPVGVMYLDDKGHCHWHAVDYYIDTPSLRDWLRIFAAGLDDVAFSAAAKMLSQKKTYERLEKAGLKWQEAGQYAVMVGLTKKSDGMPFSTADAIATSRKGVAA